MEGGFANQEDDLRKKSPEEIKKFIEAAEKEIQQIDSKYIIDVSLIPAGDPEKQKKIKTLKQKYESAKKKTKEKLNKFTTFFSKLVSDGRHPNEQALVYLRELKALREEVANKIAGAKTQKTIDAQNKRVSDKVAAILKFADENDVREEGILNLRKEVGVTPSPVETKKPKKVSSEKAEAINNVVASVAASKAKEASLTVDQIETKKLQEEVVSNAEVDREKEINDAAEILAQVKAEEEKKIQKAEQDLKDKESMLSSTTDTRPVVREPREQAVADARKHLESVKGAAGEVIAKATKVFEKVKRDASKKYEKAMGITREIAVVEKITDGKTELSGKESVEGLRSTIDHLKQEKENPNYSEEFKQGLEKRIKKLEDKVAALEAIEAEKNKNKESAIQEIKNRIEGPKEPVVPVVETPKTDAEKAKENIEARMKAWAEYQNKSKDNLDKVAEALYGPGAGFHDDQEKVIVSTPESKKDFATFLERCKEKGTGNLAKQVMSTVPGFNELPDGQKMLVLQGMNDELLNHVNQRAIEEFQKTIAGKKTKVGKMWMAVRKSYNMAKFRKAELAMLTENGAKNSISRMNFIKDKVPALVEVFGKSGVDAYLGRDGKTVITDFSNRKNFENASPYMQKTAATYNEMANILAHTPHENKAQYAKAEKAFAEAKEQFLAELHVHKAAMSDKNPEFDANMDVERAEDLMRSMSLLAADQNTTRVLSKIATDSALWAGFKDIIAQRGATFGISAGVSAGRKVAFISLGLVTLAGAPVSLAATGGVLLATAPIAALLGYYRGKKRAEGTIEDKNKLIRRGVHEKNPLLRNQQLLEAAENNLATAKSSGAPRKEQRKLKKEVKALKDAVARAQATTVGMGNVGRHVDRLTKLRAEFEASTSAIEQQQILSRMKTVHDFIEAKLERREINFGKNKPGEPVEKKVFVLQSRLMSEMRKAQATIQSKLHEEEMMNIFDKNASGAELGADTRMRRLLKVQGEGNSSQKEKALKAYTQSQALKSARNAALASTLGVSLGYFAHMFGWAHPAEVTNPDVNTVPNPQAGDFDINKYLGLDKNIGIDTTKGPAGMGGPYRIPGQVYPEPDLHEVAKATHGATKHATKAAHDALEDIAARKHPEFPTWNEVNQYHFTKAQLEGINDHFHEMLSQALNKMSPELTQYFKTTDASAFMAHKVGNITSPEARDLLKKMQYSEELLGTHPNPGETVEHYFIRMTEFRDRGEILAKIKNGENPFPGADEADIDLSQHLNTTTTTTTETTIKTEINFAPKSPIHPENIDTDEWYRNSLTTYFGGEDSRVWNRIHDLSAKDFFDRNTGLMGKQARVFREQLHDMAKGYDIEVNDKITVEQLMKEISDFKHNGVQMHEVVNSPDASRAVELAQYVAGDPKIDAWVDASVNEYFGNSKAWENISHLQARYFMSNNEAYLSRNGIVDNDAALAFRKAFAGYVREHRDDLTIGRKTTVEDVMKEIAENQKDGSTPLRELINKEHPIGSNSGEYVDYDNSPSHYE